MDAMKFLRDNRGELGMLLVLPILVIISLVVVSTFGSAIIPGAITTASNTTAISGYSTWSTQNQNLFTTVPTFISMNYLFVYVIILLTAIGIIVKVVG